MKILHFTSVQKNWTIVTQNSVRRSWIQYVICAWSYQRDYFAIRGHEGSAGISRATVGGTLEQIPASRIFFRDCAQNKAVPYYDTFTQSVPYTKNRIANIEFSFKLEKFIEGFSFYGKNNIILFFGTACNHIYFVNIVLWVSDKVFIMTALKHMEGGYKFCFGDGKSRPNGMVLVISSCKRDKVPVNFLFINDWIIDRFL